jgi:hypothetical protein
MSVRVRAACLQDGVKVLSLLESVGYFPEPIAFAQTYRKALTDPHFLVRIAEQDGRIVGMATLSLRYQIGLGGLLACLDELAIAPEVEIPRVNRALSTCWPRARSSGSSPSPAPGSSETCRPRHARASRRSPSRRW